MTALLEKRQIRQAVFLLLTLLSIEGNAQSTLLSKNSFFLEIGGNGGIGSINYEHLWLQKGNSSFTWRVGFSMAPIDKNNGTGLVFPLMMNWMTGKGAHKFELGVGQGVTITTKGHFFMLTTTKMGYRFQPSDKNLFFGISYTPLLSYIVDFQIQQWAGIHIGYILNSR